MVEKMLDAFCEDLQQAGLKYERDFVGRFLASLLAKRFVLLTGLSGSGKTQLALALARWIGEVGETQMVFHTGQTIGKYRVMSSSASRVDIAEEADNKMYASLPIDLIDEWATFMKGKDDMPPQEIRDQLKASPGTRFSNSLHAFYAPLKALAQHTLKFEKEQGHKHHRGRSAIISVGADWTNREPLLGFPNTLEPGTYIKPEHSLLDLLLAATDGANASLPFFLILDEMNLSHVERYFADFLSAMESPDDIAITLHASTTPLRAQGGTEIPARIPFPKNLFIIGTVNVDETTYMFSPKVLDRANVLEFRVSKDAMQGFLRDQRPAPQGISSKGSPFAEGFLKLSLAATSAQIPGPLRDRVQNTLIECFAHLEAIGAEFGFRTAHEIFRYVEKYATILGSPETLEQRLDHILDSAIAQKLLPKLHGSRRKLEPVLTALAGLCVQDGRTGFTFDTKPFPASRFPITFDKVCRMRERAVANGFASFAEA